MVVMLCAMFPASIVTSGVANCDSTGPPARKSSIVIPQAAVGMDLCSGPSAVRPSRCNRSWSIVLAPIPIVEGCDERRGPLGDGGPLTSGYEIRRDHIGSGRHGDRTRAQVGGGIAGVDTAGRYEGDGGERSVQVAQVVGPYRPGGEDLHRGGAQIERRAYFGGGQSAHDDRHVAGGGRRCDAFGYTRGRQELGAGINGLVSLFGGQHG